jgi:DNA polymerase V
MADHDSYTGGNTTGFASPAGDSLEHTIDLTEILDLRRPSRYLVRVAGDALAGQGILPDDILIVDAAMPPCHGKVAVVMLNGATLIGQLAFRHGSWWMQSGRPDIDSVKVEGDEAEIWAIGVGLVRTEL